MREAFIRASNLTKTYRLGNTDLVIFADLNLEVIRGASGPLAAFTRAHLHLVTHNNSFAQRCDRILRLQGGVLVPVAAAPEA